MMGRKRVRTRNSSGQAGLLAPTRDGSALHEAADRVRPAQAALTVDQALQSTGQPRDTQARALVETGLGHDFGRLRVHDEASVAPLVEALQDRQLTMEQKDSSARSRDAARSPEEQRLLASELARTIHREEAGEGGTRPAANAAREIESLNRRGVGQRQPLAAGQPARGSLPKWSEKGSTIGAIVGSILGVAAGLIAGGLLLGPVGLLAAGLVAGGLGGGALGLLLGVLLGGFLGPQVKCKYPKIRSAAVRAMKWLPKTIKLLEGYYRAYPLSRDEKAHKTIKSALDRHFHDSNDTTARDALRVIRAIARVIRPWATTKRANPDWVMSPECSGGRDNICKSAYAYVPGGMGTSRVVFCRSFFKGNTEKRAAGLVHEIAHTVGTRIDDEAYSHERLYRVLTHSEALKNAETYSHFVWEVGTGKVPPGAPRDKFAGCKGWRKPIERAVARAQFWNQNARNACGKSTPRWARRWASLSRIFRSFGRKSERKKAYKAFDKVKDKLGSPIDFECIRKGGGRCNEEKWRYWYWYWPAGWHDFHLCPAWRGLPTDDARATRMLAGLLGFYGGVDDPRRRLRYAYLARRITRDYGRVRDW